MEFSVPGLNDIANTKTTFWVQADSFKVFFGSCLKSVLSFFKVYIFQSQPLPINPLSPGLVKSFQCRHPFGQ
jgi:hypothetical protein